MADIKHVTELNAKSALVEHINHRNIQKKNENYGSVMHITHKN